MSNLKDDKAPAKTKRRLKRLAREELKRRKNNNRSHWGHLRHKYGVSKDRYNQMLIEQDSRCDICRLPEVRIVNNKLHRLSVDHNHITNKIRGLLCHKCNTGIGLLRDDIAVVEAALIYLRLNDE